MEIGIMIEGQNGLNWARWMRLAERVEALGFAGLYRSDHFTNSSPPDLDSLECWTSLTWLASNSEHLAFGQLVSPVSFRHPTMLARMAAAVDDLSGGRFRLGMGAGWQTREHENYSWDLLGVRERMDRLEEALEIVSHLLRSEAPLNFSGKYYQLNEAVVKPRPSSPGGPAITVGGNGPKRTLPLAARYADEWNGVFVSPDMFREKSDRLDGLAERVGRDPGAIKRTLMLGTFFGLNGDELDERLARRGRTLEETRSHGIVIGDADGFVEQLDAYRAAGVEGVMLQWIDLDDIDRLEAMAEAVLPVFPG